MYERTLAADRWPSGKSTTDHGLTCVMCGTAYQAIADIALCQLHQGPICSPCCHLACHPRAG